MKDFYKVLGVSPDAEQDVIDAVGKALSRKYHPDNQQTGNAQKFREVREALDVLGNVQARAGYDMTRVARRPERPRPERPEAPAPRTHAPAPMESVIEQVMRQNAEQIKRAFGKAALDIGVSAFEQAMQQNPVLETIIHGARRRRRE